MKLTQAVRAAALLAAFAFPLAARAASRIEQVVVFTDRAQVTRTGDVACGAGAQLEFSALPPSIDPASVRAEAGAATIESLEVQSRPRAEAYSPQVDALDVKLRAIAREQAEVRDAVERAQSNAKLARLMMAQGGAQIGREMTQPSPDVKAWGAAYEQALAAEALANSELQKAGARGRALERKQAELQLERGKLAGDSSASETYAKARVSCPDGETAHVSLTYVVGGASWSPSYEARADDQGAPVPGRASRPGAVELALFGTVTQTTGEPWGQARLVLSTALPRTDATPPELQNLLVYAEKREPPKKVITQRQEAREHAEAGEAGKDEAAAGDQGLSTQFTVEGRTDVPGDGTPARVELARATLPAAFAWRVFPSQLPYVFRAADVQNSAPFALLAGPVDLFRNGNMMGRARLERVAAGAPFHLSFGLEERLRVKRLVLDELSSTTGVFAKGKRFDFRYAFELQSLLPEPIVLEVADRIPVSELDDVKVTLDEKTSPGYQLEKDDGIVRWNTTLGASEKKRLELSFHVDVPGSYGM